MKNFKLYNDVEMPAIGFGVYQIPPAETERCVSDALETGYRMIDTAASYFNEKEVGNAIRGSGLKRVELFITTKLWVQDYESEDALRAFDKSMNLLGLDYLDLYLLHKPYGNYYAAWRVAEKLYREGRIKAIGVTSFSSERLQDLILHNEIKPMVNQLQTNPWYQQKQAREYLAKENIQLEAWAPFAEGKNDIFHNRMLLGIAKNHGKTVAQVILRWLIQLNIAVIPKSVSKARMAENIDIFDFDLDEKEMITIARLGTGIDPIYDDQDLETTKFIGTYKIHD